MLVAISHREPGNGAATPFDRVVLASDERRVRRKVLTLESGAQLRVDFAEPVTLAHGAMLVLDDERLVEVVAAQEALLAVTGRDQAHLVALAWHIGNRHIPAELGANRILIKRDHVLKAMLIGLGASVSEVTEAFSAEHGAYHSHGSENHALLNRK